ncbi:EVE domain-containing protein [Chromobacterium amazonense]|uniref:EVE domain-containing protein n=1 Tax=Chromobacterium amazonense TaxID=1382803 RepID=UPI0009F5B315|nr:EVE domain-containing protein [Chromobacterium amazonense]
MSTFVFQSRPDRYDLRDKIIPDTIATWHATRYRSEMKLGDLVLFWMSGDERLRGIYGWGVISSQPYVKEGWESHGVDVTYKVAFKKPIFSKSIQADSSLSSLLIFRAPQATNFLIPYDQAKKLVRLIKSRGEVIISPRELIDYE